MRKRAIIQCWRYIKNILLFNTYLAFSELIINEIESSAAATAATTFF